LITPQNAALVVIDYQPSQFAAVRSMDPDLLLENIVSTVKLANLFKLPIVHSTVNVTSGRGGPTVPELAELLEDAPAIDRTTLNAWEDADLFQPRPDARQAQLVHTNQWRNHHAQPSDAGSHQPSQAAPSDTLQPAAPDV